MSLSDHEEQQPTTTTQNASLSLTYHSNFPVPTPMKCKGDKVANWEFFRQQWEDYEIATGLDKRDQKVRLATLRSVMGKDCLQVFNNLELSVEQKSSVKACLDALEAYFKPKRNVVYERYVFNSSSQQQEESTDEYVNRLRKYAASCNFGSLTDELIRDRLVLGIRDQATKLRLLKEEKLDLNKAVSMCRASEIASKQLKSMKKESEEEIKFARGQKYSARKPKPRDEKNVKGRKTSHPKSQTKPKCGRCGKSPVHKLEECEAKGSQCRKCKKFNHWSSQCFSKPENVHAVEEFDGQIERSDSEESLLKVEEISTVLSRGKRLFTCLNFMDSTDMYATELECQLDTGATCNLLSHRDLCNINQSPSPPLQTSNVNLRLFDGTIMKPLGCTSIRVNSENNEFHALEFQVVETKSKPLLSAETCESLGLLNFKPHNTQPVYNLESQIPVLTKQEILQEYSDVFHGLGHFGDTGFVVDKDAKPVQHTPRRVPVALEKEVKEKIAEMEKKGIIVKETSPTEWISSMVVVAKPNKIRICLDPKDLNKAVLRPKYQMPTLEEILPKLNGAKVFTTLDAKDGFYQIGLDEESSKLTTFWTPFGRYRYLRLPFGISVAPEEFECKLQEKLSDLEGTHVLRDDILVVGYGDTVEEAEKNHDENLRKVLNRARQVNLKLNSKKMSLKKTEVKFMGHVISRDGLKPDPDKVKAVKDMPKPTCKQETLSLLGFINYLAKFLPRLSETAQPLRDLTVKNAKFTWAKQHDKAFAEIKQLVISHPVLRYYDVNEEVTLQCDASERGLGAVLLQNGQPVAFASRTLTETEQRYTQIEKECLSITFGAHKFSQYISRREKVTVETDHKPLESIFRKSLFDAPSRLQRMLLRLQRYNLEVGYKPGPQMFIADHLSRASIRETGPQDEEFQVFAVEVEGMGPLNSVKISSERLAQLQKATEQDPIMQTLKTTILVGWPEHREQTPVHIREYWNYREELTLHNGVLFKNQKVIIPKAMRPEMISRIHSSHLGIESCLRKARDLVFWPSMNSEIKEAVIKCSVCAEYQAKNPKQPMQSHSIPDRPWSKVGTDLFSLHSNDYIVLVDYYSDFIEVSQLDDTTTATVCDFLKEQFSRHGIPDTLVSDNGSQFTSREFTEFSKEWEFKHVTSSPYHPRSNGKAESAVKIVKNTFKKAISDDKDPWLALLDYRNTPTEGVNSSPAQRLFSRRTRTLLPVTSNLLHPKVVDGVEEKLQLKRQRAKAHYDKKAKVLPDLEVGEEVRVQGQRNTNTWTTGTCVQKLSDRSYLVNTGGQTVRRNREVLRPQQDGNSAESRADAESQHPQPPSPTVEQPRSQNKPVPKTTVQTRTRTIKPPERFKDFV